MRLIRIDLRPTATISNLSNCKRFPFITASPIQSHVQHHPFRFNPMITFVSTFPGLPLHTSTTPSPSPSASPQLTKMQTKPLTPILTKPKVTLYSMPVSNYSARVRYLISRKQIPDHQVEIRPPMDLGGLKTDQYLKINPLGKMPAAVVHASAQGDEQFLYESSVICEYLAEVFNDLQPSFIPDSPEQRARARLIANLLAEHVGPFHPFMYKKGLEERAEGVQNMHKGFDAIESILDEKGPYAVGGALSIADCCLWGNWPFYDFMLPTFFGWHPRDGRPKLSAWEKFMQRESPASRQVYQEVFQALQKWWDKGRWNDLSMTPLAAQRPEMSF